MHTNKNPGKGSLNEALFLCGVLSSLLYAGTDLIAGLLTPGYSFLNQAISEESAIGAPTRSLVVPLLFIYALLLLAFGWGVGDLRIEITNFVSLVDC